MKHSLDDFNIKFQVAKEGIRKIEDRKGQE